MVNKIEKNILLSKYTSYKIGGPAKYFFNVTNEEELIYALNFAKKNKLKVFVLGGGSNLLISDKGFKGLVIRMNISDIQIEGKKAYAGAGAQLPKFAYLLSEKGLSGLEWAAGIPATLGGSIYGHAQAFGTKISDVVESVRALDLKTLKIKNFSKSQCKFSLKNSIFKKQKNLIIISADLIFEEKEVQEVKDKVKELIEYRRARHPGFPSAGSAFVNPEIKIKNKKLLEKFPELNDFNIKGFIPAGYLIEKTGIQGTKIGNAQISEKHANFIVNLGGAKSKDVIKLIKLAQRKVKQMFDINLEPEVQIL
jgi:UDP-N-acetylmuramate dehydrogenase